MTLSQALRERSEATTALLESLKAYQAFLEQSAKELE